MLSWFWPQKKPVNCDELVKEMNECVQKDKEDPKCKELLEKVEKECKEKECKKEEQ